MLADSNGFDVAIQLVVTLGALLALAIPLWLSQQRIHAKQEQIYEHVNGLEEAERVEGAPPARPTLGTLARETHENVTAGFAHEQGVHEEIKAELRQEIATVRTDIDAIRAELRANGIETREP